MLIESMHDLLQWRWLESMRDIMHQHAHAKHRRDVSALSRFQRLISPALGTLHRNPLPT
jgi:hypothetical protein